MRHWVIICLIISTISCASSSGRSGQWEVFGDDFDLVWEAAVIAMNDIGARLVSANRPSGVILGRMNLDTTGSQVNIDVTVSRYLDSGEVRVKVLYPSSVAAQPSAMQDADAQALEELYIQAVYDAIRELRRLGARARSG